MRVPSPRIPWKCALAAAGAALLLLATAAAAPAAQWVAPVTLPTLADGTTPPDVAAAPDGTVIAVWTRLEGGKSQVVASVRAPGGAFTTPEPISALDARDPRIAIDGQGRATVVWEQRISGTQRFKIQQSTRPARGSFEVPLDLSSDADGSVDPVIAVNAAGTTIVAWARTAVGTNVFTVIEAAARPAGDVFGPKEQVSPVGAEAEMFAPRAAVGEGGTGMVTWWREGGQGESARWTLAGGFAAPVRIAISDDFVEAPDVAIDAQGTAVFAYYGVELGARAIRIQTRTAGGSASATSALASMPGTKGTEPDLQADRAGNILLAWDEHPVSPAGTSLVRAAFRPNGQAFQGVATLSSSLAASAPRAAAMSPNGDAVVAWVAPGERVQARVRPRGATSFGAVQNDFPVRTDVTHVAAFADAEGNAGALWRRTGSGDPGTIELRAFDAAPPVPLALNPPAEAIAGRPAALSASFRDTWSPFAVSWAFGDAASGTGAAVEHAYAAAGTFTATATALDTAGNASTKSGAVNVRAPRLDEIDADGDGLSAALDCDDANAAIRPGAAEIAGNAADENCDGRADALPPADADGDGFNVNQDCDDGNAAIRPGRLEVRGNAVDENCDNVREPFPRVSATATISGFFGPRFTLMQKMRVTGLAGGETVRISCKGAGCRKSMTASIRVRRKTAVLKLDKRVLNARLQKGTRLQVRISRPGFVARVIRFKIRLGDIAKRTELCQAPNASKPGSC